jgi:heptaprenyl diphosphate synthase
MLVNKKSKGISPKKIAHFSIYLALALILQAIEYVFLPPIPLPGVKIGIANIIILLMLKEFSATEIGLLVVLRVFIASLVTGMFLLPAFYLSLGGAMLSYIVIIAAYKAFYGKLSFVGIGVLGSVAHNVGQIIVAYFIISQASVFSYTPIVMLAALPFGVITGIIARITDEKMKEQVSGSGELVAS